VDTPFIRVEDTGAVVSLTGEVTTVGAAARWTCASMTRAYRCCTRRSSAEDRTPTWLTWDYHVTGPG